MHRIDTEYSDPNANGEGKPGFTDGTPIGLAPTDLDAAWFNGIQEAIAQAIEAAGIALAKGAHTLLLQAIRLLAREASGDGSTTKFVASATDADVPLFSSEQGPGDDENEDNEWKLLFRFKIPGTQRVRLYAGTGTYHFCITLNAYWTAATRQWHCDNTAVAAIQLALATNGASSAFLQMGHHTAAAASWGDLFWTPTMRFTDTGIQNLKEYRYGSARNWPIRLDSLKPILSTGGTVWSFDLINRSQTAGAAVAAATMAILPRADGDTIDRVRVTVDPVADGGITATVYKLTHDVAGAGVPALSLLASVSSSGTGRQTLTLSFSEVVDIDLVEYGLLIETSSNGDKIHSADFREAPPA